MGTLVVLARAQLTAVVPGLLLVLLSILMMSVPVLALEPQAAPAPNAVAAASVATVVVFACHDCPICTSSMPEVQRIADDYAARGVRLSVVLEDGDLTPEGVRAWAAAYCPRLQPVLDPGHARARALQAHMTPEAVVLGADGAVAYRGRIDDGWVALGRARPAPTCHDLREALDALIAGRSVRQPATTAVGCVIEFDDRRTP
jgi:hypothetical protein